MPRCQAGIRSWLPRGAGEIRARTGSCYAVMYRLKLLVRIIYDPRQAIGELQRRAPYWTALFWALLVSIIYYSRLTGFLLDLRDLAVNTGQLGWRGRFLFYTVLPGLIEQTALPLFFLAAFFVPISLVVVGLYRRQGRIGRFLLQEYPGLFSVILYAWAAAHLLVAGPALILFSPRSAYYREALLLAPLPYFGFLAILVIRQLFGVSLRRAFVTVLLAVIGVPVVLFGPVFLLSTIPFIVIFWLVIVLRGYLSEALASYRARVRFEQSLVTATLNPADASAHYNLGRIYQQRGQLTEAISSYQRAIEIDQNELDAHYQLGRIAREQGRFSDAIGHFENVVRRELEYSQSEIWREVGVTYYSAGQLADAESTLARFLAKRPSDAEGMYHYGLTLFKLGQLEESLKQMRAVVETVKSAPAYKYRTDRRWMIEAQSFLRSQAV